MPLVTPTQVNPDDEITASSVNTPINQITSVVNGGIDTSNVSSIDGSKIADSSITATKLTYGVVRNRQGGASGDASWGTSGTTNTDTKSKPIFIQVGSIASSASGDVTVTFPVAFSQTPLVFVSVNGNNAGTGAITQNAFALVANKTSTNFVVRTFNTSGSQSDQNVAWQAIGQ